MSPTRFGYSVRLLSLMGYCGFQIVLLAGCARYASKPLVPEEVFAAAQKVRLDDLVAESGKTGLLEQPRINLADGLDLDEVAYAALFLSPSLKAKRADKGIAAGQLIDAGLWPRPEFSSNFRWEKDGRGRSFEPELAVEILRWDERKGKREAAKANVEAVRYEILADEWSAVSDARTAYWNVVAVRERLRINQESVALTEMLAKSVQTRVIRGVATSMDQNLAELESTRAKLEGRHLEGDLKAAERGLRQAIGLPPNAEMKLQVPEKPLVHLKRSWTYEDAVDCLTGTPALMAAEWRYNVSEGELRAAVARQFPGLKIGPSNSVEFSGSWTAFLGFLVAVDLPLLNRNHGEIKEKEAAREKARAEYVAQLHELRGQMAEAVGRVETAERELEYQEREVLPKAQETIRLTERALEAGEVAVWELFKAQTSIIEIKQRYLDSLVEYRSALQTVERAFGRPLSRLTHATPEPKPMGERMQEARPEQHEVK